MVKDSNNNPSSTSTNAEGIQTTTVHEVNAPEILLSREVVEHNPDDSTRPAESASSSVIEDLSKNTPKASASGVQKVPESTSGSIVYDPRENGEMIETYEVQGNNEYIITLPTGSVAYEVQQQPHQYSQPQQQQPHSNPMVQYQYYNHHQGQQAQGMQYFLPGAAMMTDSRRPCRQSVDYSRSSQIDCFSALPCRICGGSSLEINYLLSHLAEHSIHDLAMTLIRLEQHFQVAIATQQKWRSHITRLTEELNRYKEYYAINAHLASNPSLPYHPGFQGMGRMQHPATGHFQQNHPYFSVHKNPWKGYGSRSRWSRGSIPMASNAGNLQLPSTAQRDEEHILPHNLAKMKRAKPEAQKSRRVDGKLWASIIKKVLVRDDFKSQNIPTLQQEQRDPNQGQHHTNFIRELLGRTKLVNVPRRNSERTKMVTDKKIATATKSANKPFNGRPILRNSMAQTSVTIPPFEKCLIMRKPTEPVFYVIPAESNLKTYPVRGESAMSSASRVIKDIVIQKTASRQQIRKLNDVKENPENNEKVNAETYSHNKNIIVADQNKDTIINENRMSTENNNKVTSPVQEANGQSKPKESEEHCSGDQIEIKIEEENDLKDIE